MLNTLRYLTPLFILLVAGSPTADAQEDCGNGLDDDGDGLIDCFDPDCSGGTVPTGAYFNTATNGMGGVLPGGSNDSHWSISTGSIAGPYVPAVVMSSTPGSYYSSPWPDCDWISHSASGSHGGNTDYYYKIQFYLPCTNGCGTSYASPGVFCLNMDFFCDNSVDAVYVNGVMQTGLPGVPAVNPYYNVGFNAAGMVSLSLCNNWQPGLNELVIKVCSGGPYAGFLAQNSITAPPPTGDPTVSLPPGSPGSYCANVSPIALTAASPGGSWSASCGTCIDVITGIFDPSLADAGPNTIAYTLTTPCPASDSIVINVTIPDDPTIATASLLLCANAAPVTLTAVAGGTWSATCGSCIDAVTGEFDPSIGAGTYVVTYAFTACGVSDTSLVQVVAVSNATITGPVAPLTLCPDDAPLGFTTASAGGTWSADCGTCLSSTGMFDPALVAPGTYTVYYTFGGLCPDADTTSLVVAPSPEPVIPDAGPFCAYETAVNLTALPAGGTWSGPGITSASAGTFDPGTAGTGPHMITYTTAGVCPQSASIDIAVHETVIDSLSPLHTCPGLSNGQVLTYATSDLPLTYTLNIPALAVNGTGVFDHLDQGHYLVIAVNSAGCSDTAAASIGVFPAVQAAVSPHPPVCEGDLVSLYASGGDHYTWLPQNTTGTASGNQFTFEAAPTAAVIEVVAESNGCTDTAGTTVVVYAMPVLDAGEDVVYDYAPGPLLDPQVPGNELFYWWPAEGLSCTLCLNPEATPSVTTTYYLYYTGPNGCTAVDSVTVWVSPSVYVPNAFSPNGDGINDVFMPVTRNLETYQLMVFDRWGELIFSSENTGLAWDGRHHQKPVKADVYVWTLSYSSQLEPGITKTLRGHVVLIR